MTKEDYLFDARLKRVLERALLDGNFTVSCSISAGGGSKSVTYTGRDQITRELEACRARMARARRCFFSRGMFYPGVAR